MPTDPTATAAAFMERHAGHRIGTCHIDGDLVNATCYDCYEKFRQVES